MFLNNNILNIAIIIILSLLSIDTKSQEILFPKTNLTIKETFKEIENQTDYLISYPARSIDLKRNITLTFTRLSWEKALEEALQSSDYTSDVRGHHILIVPVKKKPIEKVTTPASNINITVLENNITEQEKQSEKDLVMDMEKMLLYIIIFTIGIHAKFQNHNEALDIYYSNLVMISGCGTI